jgi:hypothetical protein
MKAKILFSICVAMISIFSTTGLPLVEAQSARVASDQKITVLNPIAANAVVARIPLSSRLNSLDGKTIYMVDIGWGGPEAGYDVLQVISKWFAQKMPAVKTVVVRKKGSYGTDDPELWKEIRAKGQAAILGISC